MTSRELLAGPMVATIFVRRMTPLSTYGRRTPATKEPFDPLAAAGIPLRSVHWGVASLLRLVMSRRRSAEATVSNRVVSRSEGLFRPRSPSDRTKTPACEVLLGFVSAHSCDSIHRFNNLLEDTLGPGNSFPDYEAGCLHLHREQSLGYLVGSRAAIVVGALGTPVQEEMPGCVAARKANVRPKLMHEETGPAQECLVDLSLQTALDGGSDRRCQPTDFPRNH
jgi:hypothetical protein